MQEAGYLILQNRVKLWHTHSTAYEIGTHRFIIVNPRATFSKPTNEPARLTIEVIHTNGSSKPTVDSEIYNTLSLLETRYRAWGYFDGHIPTAKYSPTAGPALN